MTIIIVYKPEVLLCKLLPSAMTCRKPLILVYRNFVSVKIFLVCRILLDEYPSSSADKLMRDLTNKCGEERRDRTK